jgi:hypothetical protein
MACLQALLFEPFKIFNAVEIGLDSVLYVFQRFFLGVTLGDAPFEGRAKYNVSPDLGVLFNNDWVFHTHLVIGPLRDPNVFAQVRVAMGTVQWAKGADLASGQTPWHDGGPLRLELNNGELATANP